MEQSINNVPKIDSFCDNSQVKDYVIQAKMLSCVWAELKKRFPNEDTTGRYEKCRGKILGAKEDLFLRLKGQFKNLEPYQFLDVVL